MMMILPGTIKLRRSKRLVGLSVWIYMPIVPAIALNFSGTPEGCLSTLAGTGSPETIITITDQKSLDSIINCTSITGTSLNISTFTGDFVLPNTVNFSGSITAQDLSYPFFNTSNLTSVSLPRIQGDFGGIVMGGLASLRTLDLPLVDYVTGSIVLELLPNLSTLNMPSLTGCDQGFGAAGIGIENLSLNFTNTSQIEIKAEGIGPNILQLTGRPNITMNLVGVVDQFYYDGVVVGGGLEVVGASEITLPNLKSVGGLFAIANGTFGSSFVSALNLETVGGYFLLENNTMSQTEFTSLKTVNGGFRISNNTGLRSVVTDDFTGTGGFPVLHTVVDDIKISGNFSNFTLPQLASVGGGFSFTTTDSSFDCSAFDDYRKQGIIKGLYNCQVGTTNAASPSVSEPANSPSVTQSSKQSSGLSKNSKIGLGVGIAVAILAFGAAALWFFLIMIPRRKRKALNQLSGDRAKSSSEKTEMSGDSKEMVEMEQNLQTLEMDGQKNRTELPVEEAPVELDTERPLDNRSFHK